MAVPENVPVPGGQPARPSEAVRPVGVATTDLLTVTRPDGTVFSTRRDNYHPYAGIVPGQGVDGVKVVTEKSVPTYPNREGF